jgi:hypothetical protein
MAPNLEFSDNVIWMLDFLYDNGYGGVAESIVQMLDRMSDTTECPQYYY